MQSQAALANALTGGATRAVDHANLALALILVALLVAKELTADAAGPWRALNRALALGIIPLMIAFFATVVIKVVQYLG